ncbi:uncharacterized protein BO97DRAFT_127809 [Aspergillus homomorphus CBS 101889]|uniref:Transmembrane protein n=1 Tax=Aspergillus homomorphus (strain CBS 101889) TaxID=1450537 RepID=A0A395HRB7_ASPHC|nr:hypothetical protein BO97DRAFT_127809 [Aspergillus homomorphus CBS 101889]RAL10501.1 hypothetical protein BO97DRAFT_127809 [Aspergillus homomorphus CBS 101889]
MGVNVVESPAKIKSVKSITLFLRIHHPSVVTFELVVIPSLVHSSFLSFLLACLPACFSACLSACLPFPFSLNCPLLFLLLLLISSSPLLSSPPLVPHSLELALSVPLSVSLSLPLRSSPPCF